MKLIAEATLVATFVIVAMQQTQNPLLQEKIACRCGTMDEFTKVVHGIPASKKQSAMMSALHSRKLYEEQGLMGSFLCGASLVALNYLLSAAHCAEKTFCINTKDHQVCYYHALVANLGDYDLESQTEAENVVIQVTSIIVHPHFIERKMTKENDIALFKLATKATLSYNIRLTCLPQYPINLDGERVQVAGWGEIETGPNSPILLQVTLTVISNEICNKAHQHIEIKDTTFCTGDPHDHKGVCFGDSGSPLYYTCKEGFDAVVGLVSFGKAPCGQQYPNINTRVAPYVPWIMENTGYKACPRQCTRSYN